MRETATIERISGVSSSVSEREEKRGNNTKREEKRRFI